MLCQFFLTIPWNKFLDEGNYQNDSSFFYGDDGTNFQN